MTLQARAEPIGRDDELATLRAFLSSLDDGPGVIVLEGPAGIGKTTIWRAAVDAARDRSITALAATPAESERGLSFVVLGDLLDGVLDALSELPAPQGRALAMALLRVGDAARPPDHRAVALAFLGVLRSLAARGAVVVAVDDAQWLDAPSAFVLQFALRRLREERVGFLVALSADWQLPLVVEPELRLERLAVGPVPVAALRRLLSGRLGLVLSGGRLHRIHELSGGNPFFALELGRAFQRGAVHLEADEPLPGTLAALVRDRLALLPVDTRSALLVASALSQPTLELVRRATGADPSELLAPARSAQVVELDGDRIRFLHPLLESGVYASADAAARRALHRRLADLVPDPEERARQLALGSEGPDSDVAAVLEQAASRARSRGALAAAVELSEQARRLTPVDRRDERHRRTLQAAAYAFEAGESDRTRALVEGELDTAAPGGRRARVLGWLAILEQYEGDRGVAVELFRRALAEAGDDDALRAELERWIADCLFLMRTELAAAVRHVRAAVTLARRVGDTSREVGALAELGLIEAIVGRQGWRATLERAAALEREAEPLRLVESPLFALAVNLTWADELDQARTILRSLRDRADERAEESALPWILANLSQAEYLAGDWVEAGRLADEAAEFASETGQEPQRAFALGVRALVQACRGDEARARADAKAAIMSAEERGVMIATILASSAVGLLELSLGHPAAAHAILGPLGERLERGGVREPGSTRFLTDEIESLIQLGRLDEAGERLARLERRARRLSRTSTLAAAGRSRGLLAAAHGDLDGAITALERAMAVHERVAIPFDRARTLLALGRTQRRAKLRRAARETLDEASEVFEELGARMWAEATRAERARIGGRQPGTGRLTPTERHIVELVAEGRSNKDVAVALFVTPKTVGTKLSRIYAKLGVHSRTELARHLADVGRVDKL